MGSTPRGPVAVPARITLALDAIGAYGPWVDQALGGAEPMVDQWEAGETSPTREQVEALARLTGQTVEWFYLPADEIPTGRVFICDRRRRGENGLTVIEPRVDWDGVLHVDELTPPRPPYRPRPPASTSSPRPAPAGPGAHRPSEDPDAPGCCVVCGVPMGAPNARHA